MKECTIASCRYFKNKPKAKCKDCGSSEQIDIKKVIAFCVGYFGKSESSARDSRLIEKTYKALQENHII